jgi:hypothetical protein
MTTNIVKNFAAATVAGTVVSFVVASTVVSVAVVVHIASGQNAGQTKVSSVQHFVKN